MKVTMETPEKTIDEMPLEELKEFRIQFDTDMMGFDGKEGVNEDGSK